MSPSTATRRAACAPRRRRSRDRPAPRRARRSTRPARGLASRWRTTSRARSASPLEQRPTGDATRSRARSAPPERPELLTRDDPVVERARAALRRLAGLVALARDDDDVAGARPRRARRRWPTRRSSSTVTEAGPAARPGSTASAIACGSSERGLSEVSTATSAVSATAAPISGRLAGSRSPPHPKTHDHPPAGAGEGAGGGQHAAEGIGRVGVVDQHGEGLAGVDPLEAARYDQGLRQPVGDRGEGVAGRPRRGRGRECVGEVERTRRGGGAARRARPRDGRRGWTRCRPVRTTAPRRSRRRSRRRRRRSRGRGRSRARASASSTPYGSSRLTRPRIARVAGRTVAPSPRSTRPASRGSRGARD